MRVVGDQLVDKGDVIAGDQLAAVCEFKFHNRLIAKRSVERKRKMLFFHKIFCRMGLHEQATAALRMSPFQISSCNS